MIEIVQPYFGRSRSSLDFLYDCIGVFFSAIFFIRHHTRPRKPAITWLILFISITTLLPTYRVYLWWQINQTNILFNFERPWERVSLNSSEGVSVKLVSSMAPFKNKGMVGKVNFGLSDIYPGFGLNYPKSDWRSFSTLNWDVVSFNSQAIELNLRIHDVEHNRSYSDRFNRKFWVMPGLNTFSVALHEIENAPKSRKLDIANIENIKFFVAKPKQAITLYFDHLELH